MGVMKSAEDALTQQHTPKIAFVSPAKTLLLHLVKMLLLQKWTYM